MSAWILVSAVVVTCAYAFYEMRRARRVRWLGAGGLVSGAALMFAIFGLDPLLTAFHTPSSYDPIGDGIGVAIVVMCVAGALFLVHFGLVALLMWRADPDELG